MGQIINKNIGKKTKKHKKYIKMRIPSWDSPGVLDQHSGVTLPRRRPKNAKHDGQMGQISNKIKNTARELVGFYDVITPSPQKCRTRWGNEKNGTKNQQASTTPSAQNANHDG